MRAEDLPLAVLALLTLVVAVPPWMEAWQASELTQQTAWMLGLALPTLAVLFVVSWVKPSLVPTVMGAFVLSGVLVLAPQLWKLTGMAAGRLSGGLAQLAIQVALPVLVVTYMAGLGWRRAKA